MVHLPLALALLMPLFAVVAAWAIWTRRAGRRAWLAVALLQLMLVLGSLLYVYNAGAAYRSNGQQAARQRTDPGAGRTRRSPPAMATATRTTRTRSEDHRSSTASVSTCAVLGNRSNASRCVRV